MPSDHIKRVILDAPYLIHKALRTLITLELPEIT